MRALSPDWRTCLSASMFTLKIYSVIAALWFLIWHLILSRNGSLGPFEYDTRWLYSFDDLQK
jgi:hypothetical protein